ncbi:hypothetical protein [Pseudomonas serbica]
MELSLFYREGLSTAKPTQHVERDKMTDGLDERPDGSRPTQTEACTRLMKSEGEQGGLMNL